MTTYDQFVAPFHPMFVHFPIVLLIIGLVCDIIALVGREHRKGIRVVGHWMIITGAIFCVPSVLSGWGAGKLFGWEDPGLILHRTFAIMTGVLAIINALLRIVILRRKNLKMIVFPLVLSILTVSLVSWTGELGGVLAHGITPFQKKSIAQLAREEGDRGAVFKKNLSPKHVEEVLKEGISLADVEEIFNTHKCMQCHRDEFQEGSLTNLASEWLPRDEKGNLLSLEQVPLYTVVVVDNAMPPNKGLDDAERLDLLVWLRNGAPM